MRVPAVYRMNPASIRGGVSPKTPPLVEASRYTIQSRTIRGHHLQICDLESPSSRRSFGFGCLSGYCHLVAHVVLQGDLTGDELVGGAVRSGYVEFAIGGALLQAPGYRYVFPLLLFRAAFALCLSEHPCGGRRQECTQDQS